MHWLAIKKSFKNHVNVFRIQSICQDIIFLSSRGHKLTPKHFGIGLTVHQATRSKQLVQLLHTAGHSVNYDTVLRMDNTIANDALERYKESGNVLVPGNFTRTRSCRLHSLCCR